MPFQNVPGIKRSAVASPKDPIRPSQRFQSRHQCSRNVVTSHERPNDPVTGELKTEDLAYGDKASGR